MHSELEQLVAELPCSANDPYNASIKVTAYALLGNKDGFVHSMLQMLAGLYGLQLVPDAYPEWMQNNAFQAWMWGRVLLAADNLNYFSVTKKAEKKLRKLLDAPRDTNNNAAFFAWARGYHAAFTRDTYQVSKDLMMQEAAALSQIPHIPLPDILWAWIMNLSAAANASDKETYEHIKKQILLCTQSDSVASGLTQKLTRTENNNDYPAWALAKVRHAAALLSDKVVFEEAGLAINISIAEAHKLPSKAEYVLAVIENQLAVNLQRSLEHTHERTPSL